MHHSSKSAKSPVRHLEILVTSYGGSGTNLLAHALDKHRCCITEQWHSSLCHSLLDRGTIEVLELLEQPRQITIPIVCILANPILAFQSQVNRGYEFCRVNARKINSRLPAEVVTHAGEDITYAPGVELMLLLESMHRYSDAVGQAICGDSFLTGSGETRRPILVVKYEHLPRYLPTICNLLKLKRQLAIDWQERRTTELKLPPDCADHIASRVHENLKYMARTWHHMPTFMSNF